MLVVAMLLASAVLVLFPAVASAAPGERWLTSGQQLGPGEQLVSTDGRYVLQMQLDGNLVQRAYGNLPVWDSGTDQPGSVLRMQQDGNLVVVAPGNTPAWSTGTADFPGAVLELQDDGNLIVYSDGHTARWSSFLDGSSVPDGPVSSPQPSPAAHAYPAEFSPARAAEWALRNHGTHEPGEPDDSCTFFVSRALLAGGLPQDSDWWSPNDAVSQYMYSARGALTSVPWVRVQALKNHLIDQGWIEEIPLDPRDPESASAARPGDILYYQWRGEDTTHNVHLAIVTSMAESTALVADQSGREHSAGDRVWSISGLRPGVPLVESSPDMAAYLLRWK